MFEEFSPDRCVTIVFLVLLAAAVQEIECVPHPHGIGLPQLDCKDDSRVNAIEVDNPNQEIFLRLSSHFKYLQISMKISSCYSHPIFRGNRFITGKTLNASKTEMMVPLVMSHTVVDGMHAYHLTIKTDTITFSDVINTSVKCGNFQEFQVKAVGAALCTSTKKKLNDPALRPRRSNLPNYVDYAKGLRDIHRWADGAYVMAICFSISFYVIFLIGKSCQNRTEYKVMDERITSIVPVDAT